MKKKNRIKSYVIAAVAALCLMGSMAVKAGMQDLIKAIDNNNIDEVRGILKNDKSIDINSLSTLLKDGATLSAFGVAIAVGNIEIIKLFLAQNPKPNLEVVEKSYNGTTRSALRVAIINDKIEVIKLLLAQDPKPNLEVVEKSSDGATRSALGAAIQMGNREVITLLLRFAKIATLEILNPVFLRLRDTEPEEKDLKDFILWIQGKQVNVSDKDMHRFAAIAFTMPDAQSQFKESLLFIRKGDFSNVFTSAVIKNALMTRNIEGFTLLLEKASQNDVLVKNIKDELKTYEQNYGNVKFADALKKMLNKFDMQRALLHK
jgi:hypothetical protein